MSEKKERTVPEISQEYSGLCTKAGHLQYQINTLQKDLELLNGTLRDLNLEAAAVQAKAAPAPEATPAVEAAPADAPAVSNG
jgi:hypothetical protein